jgi:hypothetical protein
MYWRARLKEWFAKRMRIEGSRFQEGVALRLTKNRTELQVFEQQSLKLFATIVSTGLHTKFPLSIRALNFQTICNCEEYQSIELNVLDNH